MPSFALPAAAHRIGSRLGTGVLVAVVAACAAPGPSIPLSAPADRVPTIELQITGGPAAGAFASDPTASLNLCSRQSDGAWRAMYAGGSPWMSIDLLIGPEINKPGHESDAALEVTAGSGYLWIAQGGVRAGDAPGRSRISVEINPSGGLMNFVVRATTPNRTANGDGPTSDVVLTLACPV